LTKPFALFTVDPILPMFILIVILFITKEMR